MNKFVLVLFCTFVVSGCVTKKLRTEPDAKNITEISEYRRGKLNCEIVKVQRLEKVHPNNVIPTLQNATLAAGGNHYSINAVLATRKSRPTSLIAELLECDDAYNLTASAQYKKSTTLLPGAKSVEPISFVEAENNECKILTTYVVEKTAAKNLNVELKNETYMKSGNRFHITKILEIENGQPTSVVADLYRCRHQSVNF
ncbi:hypothetical protein [Psychromonas aquimarina]|uniref:hypothetical protein n=1 Tax=Psychromonas aquimarina TaxID=444919 RepID=UPI000414C0D6|nr:hypothetical protein [Psychromonas aquimarina]